MITVRQLREALRLAGMESDAAAVTLGARAAVPDEAGSAGLTDDAERLLRASFATVGIMILPEHGDDLGIRQLPERAKALRERDRAARRRSRRSKVDP